MTLVANLESITDAKMGALGVEIACRQLLTSVSQMASQDELFRCDTAACATSPGCHLARLFCHNVMLDINDIMA